MSRDFNSIRGIGGDRVTAIYGQTNFDITGETGSPTISVTALVMDQVLGNHPLTPLSPYIGRSVSGLPLADPMFWKPGPVDLLIGTDIIGQVLCSGTVVGLHQDGLIAVPSSFGYLIMGPAPHSFRCTDRTVLTGVSLTEVVQRF